jgi:hypothetical protein
MSEGVVLRWYTCAMNNKTIAWVAVVVGVLCIGIAIYYWITPAGSLASFVPGYEPGVAAVHVKHGIAAFAVGVLALVLAWFKSA